MGVCIGRAEELRPLRRRVTYIILLNPPRNSPRLSESVSAAVVKRPLWDVIPLPSRYTLKTDPTLVFYCYLYLL